MLKGDCQFPVLAWICGMQAQAKQKLDLLKLIGQAC